MYLQQVKNIMASRRIHRASLARLAQVSRAAVTRWFRFASPEGWINVETRTLLALATGLEMSPEFLLKEVPGLEPFEVRFLWDRFYPSMEDFVQALVQGRPPAVARLVEVVGFRAAMRVVGKRVVRGFARYKRFIKPVRRRELEILWPLYNSQI